MSEAEIKRLEIMITEISSKLDTLSVSISELKTERVKDQEKSDRNAERLTRAEVCLENTIKDLQHNFDQHKKYDIVQDKMERLEGMGLMLKIIFGASITSTIGLIITAFKVFS